MAMIKHTSFNGAATVTDLTSKMGWYDYTNISIQNLDGYPAIFFNNVSITYSRLRLSFPDKAGLTLVMGFHLKITRKNIQFLELEDSAQNQQLNFAIDANGKLIVRLWTTVLGTSATTVADGTKRFIEIKVLIANTGSIEVKINENVEISLSNTDTQYRSTNSVAYLMFMTGEILTGSAADMYIQNLYLLDSSGSTHNNYLGEVVSLPVTVNGDNSIQWLNQSGGVASYTNIDETIGSPNLTDYNESSVSGSIDKYTLSDVTAAAIHCLTLYATLQKSDTGAIQCNIGTDVGGNVQNQTINPGTGWATYSVMLPYKFSTSLWTPTDFNNALATVSIV